MKKVLFVVAAGLLVAGCTVKLDGVNEPSRKEDTGETVEGKVFASAMVFPEGIHWQKEDSEEKGKLILLADGDIRSQSEDYSPWNSHFVVNGRLYVEDCAEGRTSLREKGESVCAWEGEESIWDVAMDGKSLLCLCTDADGTVLRQDGKCMLRAKGMWPDSGFYPDGKQLCVSLTGEKLGIIRGKELKTWSLNPEYISTTHMLGAAGKDCFYMDAIFSDEEGHMHIGGIEDRFEGLLYDGDGLFAEYVTKDGIYQIRTSDNKTLFSSKVPFSRRSVAIDRNDIWALGRLESGMWAVFHEGRFALLPEEVTVRGGTGICVKYGRVLFPVVTANGTAAVWDTGNMINLGFNGYVDHISIGRGSSKDFYLSR